MNIVNRLTLRHLRLNRGRTAITLAGIVLSIAMVCCVSGFVMSVRDLLIREVKASKGDYHVAYLGVTEETASAIAREDVFSSSYIKDSGGVDGSSGRLLNIYLRMKNPGRDISDTAGAIAAQYHLPDYGINNELLALEGVIPNDNVLANFITIAVIAIAVIIVGSVVVIANAFYISSSERVRQFGLLKSVGATAGQLRRSVLFEAFVLTAAAIPIGLLLGFLIQAAVLRLTNGILSEMSALNGGLLTFHVVVSPAVIGISIIIAVLTVLLSARSPARRAASVSPVDAIRRSGDIVIRAKQLKSSALTRRLFGFEGTLAAKSLKRSRGKYRATVISLSFSVIMLISMTSFVGILRKSVEMEYGGYDFDAMVYTQGSMETMDAANNALRSLPGTQLTVSRRAYFETTVPDGFITDQSPESMTTENGFGLFLRPMPDDELALLLPAAESGINGLLINTALFTLDGTRYETIPYDCEPGVELPLLAGGSGEDSEELSRITIGAVVTEIPESLPSSLFDSTLINVFISESAYRSLYAEHEEIFAARTETVYTATSSNPDAFCEAAEELLSSVQVDDDYGFGYSVQNVSQITRFSRNIILIVMLFGYGFIAMLSLIAVTSVVATISTGMALRRQEFAMLYSVGMTPEGMDKMLNLESLMYGIRSLIIGLPVGAALSYLIHSAMSDTFVFPYEPPYAAMAVSAAAILLLTFATMRYGKRKLSKLSIVETIRGETA